MKKTTKRLISAVMAVSMVGSAVITASAAEVKQSPYKDIYTDGIAYYAHYSEKSNPVTEKTEPEHYNYKYCTIVTEGYVIASDLSKAELVVTKAPKGVIENVPIEMSGDMTGDGKVTAEDATADLIYFANSLVK